jgi:hypothetical protein
VNSSASARLLRLLKFVFIFASGPICVLRVHVFSCSSLPSVFCAIWCSVAALTHLILPAENPSKATAWIPFVGVGRACFGPVPSYVASVLVRISFFIFSRDRAPASPFLSASASTPVSLLLLRELDFQCRDSVFRLADASAPCFLSCHQCVSVQCPCHSSQLAGSSISFVLWMNYYMEIPV